MSKDNSLKKGNIVSAFLLEVQSELKQVNWPTRPDIIRLTSIVVGVTALVGAYLGGLDYLFTYLMGFII